MEAAILEEGRKLVTVTIPDGMVHQEVERIIERMKESVEQGVSFDRYMESIKKLTMIYISIIHRRRSQTLKSDYF